MRPPHILIEDLKAVAQEGAGSLSPRPSDSAFAFLLEAMHWVIEWAARHGPVKSARVLPFALMAHDLNLLREDPRWALKLLFKEAHPLGVGGHLFATSTSMFEVRARKTRARDLSSLAEELLRDDLVDLPTVIVDPAAGCMHLCPLGAAQPRLRLRLQGDRTTALSQGAVDEALEQFHLEQTAYPDGFAHVWYDRKTRVLLRQAEAIVRDQLMLFLHREFTDQLILREELHPAGRSDISIHEMANGWKASCLLELKVLRTRGLCKSLRSPTKSYSAESMLRHALRGLRQVSKYKASSQASLAYLCAFDGRDEDAELPEVVARAADGLVHWRRFFMHTSTRDDLDEGIEDKPRSRRPRPRPTSASRSAPVKEAGETDTCPRGPRVKAQTAKAARNKRASPAPRVRSAKG